MQHFHKKQNTAFRETSFTNSSNLLQISLCVTIYKTVTYKQAHSDTEHKSSCKIVLGQVDITPDAKNCTLVFFGSSS